jgi:hypothetical protein
MMKYLMQEPTKQPDPSNPVHKEVRTPKYRQRIEEDKTKYKRKKKHKEDQDEG